MSKSEFKPQNDNLWQFNNTLYFLKDFIHIITNLYLIVVIFSFDLENGFLKAGVGYVKIYAYWD